MDNDQTRFFTSIMDQQLAQNLSTHGKLGFAKLIEQAQNFLYFDEPSAKTANRRCASGSVAGGSRAAQNFSASVTDKRPWNSTAL